MMDWQRIGLLLGIAAVLVTLLFRWNAFQEARLPEIETETTITEFADPGANFPSANPGSSLSDQGDSAVPGELSQDEESNHIDAAAPTLTASRKLIKVTTDSLNVSIDTLGGDIVMVALPKFPVTIEQPDNPLIILNRTQSTTYIAQSGLVGRNGTDTAESRPLFSSAADSYTLSEGEDELQVDLHFQQDDVKITKRYTFKRSDYLVRMEYLVDNQSGAPWTGRLYGQILRDDHKPGKNLPAFAMSSFLGVSTTTEEENYKKMDFDDIAEDRFSQTKQDSWIALVQHYFISAWVPNPELDVDYDFRQLKGSGLYRFLFQEPRTTIAPGEQATMFADFYVGPKDVYRLEDIAPNLELVADYGPLWFICKPLFYFLNWLYSFLGNWGVAIIVLTICIKAAFFHLSATSYRSMAKMRKFAPKMAELKERYGDNRQKLQEETMKLYRKEKVNPLGGCLPMLVQIPVFIALYWTLMESVELRHAPFMLWINDLSAKDPYFILPLLYGTTFWFQQKLNPQMGDPTQQKIMQMMPWVFTIFFLFFPSGLVLYWVVNGLLSMAQQYVITKQIENADAKA
ncbi:membrane protein insertase YidC [Aurantivibrio plasticivorans]